MHKCISMWVLNLVGFIKDHNLCVPIRRMFKAILIIPRCFELI